MNSASPLETFPPAWAQKGWAKRLVHVNKAKKTLGPSVLGHAVIFLVISTVALGLYVGTRRYVTSLSSDWRICPVESGQSQVDQKPQADQKVGSKLAGLFQILGLFSSTPQQAGVSRPDLNEIDSAINLLDDQITPSQKKRLSSQVAQLREAQSTACQIGVFFYANRLAALTVCTVAATLTFSSLAFVSKKGWEDTNNVVITAGLSFALVLFTAWSLSQLYGQDVNYESQRTKAILATNLLNSVASAVANQAMIRPEVKPADSAKPEEKTLPLNSQVNMTMLIQSIDKQLEVINDLKFGGDSSFAEEAAQKVGKLLNSTPLPEPAKP